MAIRFNVFEANRDGSRYGGVARLAPWFNPNLSTAYNTACLEISEEPEGLIRLEDAHRLAAVFQNEGVAVEVVGVEQVTARATRSWTFMGYDVASFRFDSFLQTPGVFGGHRRQNAWGRVLTYIEQTVESKLNERRLFASWDDALQAMTVVAAVRELNPEWFEAQFEPAIYAVYLVPE